MDDAKARAIQDEVRQGWADEARGWVKHAALLTEWTEQGTQLTMEGARPRPGDAALDVACGSGTLTFPLADRVRPGQVTGCDLVPEMVAGASELARERGVRNVTFREADAQAMPFADASFDVVTCRHGVMFFARPEQALREFHRVLKPGGRAALLAWGPPEANPLLTTVMGPFVRRMPPQPDDPDAPTPFRFAQAGSLAKVLRAAGFADVHEESRQIGWDFPGTAEEFLAAAPELSSSAFAWFRAELSPQDFAHGMDELRTAVRQREQGGRVRFTATMVLATGTR